MSACSPTNDVSEDAPSTATVEYRERVWAQKFADCLTENGWSINLEDDNSVSANMNVEQQPAYDQAVQECSEPLEELTFNTPLSELTQEQWDTWYALETTTADCLRTEGINVPEIPSQQVFIEQAQSGNQWHSWSHVSSLSQDRWNELNELCPQPSM